MSGPTLATRIGVTSGAVTQYEGGRNAPALKRLELIAEALGVTAKWLLTGDEPEENVRAQTVNEAEALELIRRLSARRQSTALKQLRAMVEEEDPPSK